jgi:CheY-like chemotaxis protein
MAQILVIDDSPTAVEKARSTLEKQGHTVSSLHKMIDLAGLLKTDPPELVLLDLSMPGLSGDAFAKLIKQFAPSPIPIVLFSSRPREELAEKARILEVDGYVSKRDPPEQLTLAIERALAVSQHGNSARVKGDS